MEKVEVVVRDLADGRPIPGVSLRLDLAGPGVDAGSVAVSADQLGIVKIPLDGIQAIRADSEGWFTPRYRSGEVQSSGELWLHGAMSVRVSVRATESARDFDPRAVRLAIKAQGTGELPWTRFWFDSHDLGRYVRPPSPGARGVSTFRIPRIRGLLIQASAPGWQPAGAEIPVPHVPGAFSSVDLELGAASIPIQGRLTGSDGKPLANALVTAYITIETTAEQLDRAKYRLAGHAWTLRIYSKTGRALVTFIVWGRTNSSGAFRIESNVKGDVVLVVYPPEEHKPVSERVGALSDEGLTADLQAAAGPRGKRVQILRGGAPLRGAKLVISDIALVPHQPTFSVKLDSNGRMPTSWLTLGHRYTLDTAPPTLPVEFEWRGQKSLDFDILWRELGEYLKSRQERGK